MDAHTPKRHRNRTFRGIRNATLIQGAVIVIIAIIMRLWP